MVMVGVGGAGVPVGMVVSGSGWSRCQASGEVALEAADGLAASLALGLSACEVGGGLGVQAAFDDGEAVEGAVELAVAAAVEAMALRAPRGGGDRR